MESSIETIQDSNNKAFTCSIDPIMLGWQTEQNRVSFNPSALAVRFGYVLWLCALASHLR